MSERTPEVEALLAARAESDAADAAYALSVKLWREAPFAEQPPLSEAMTAALAARNAASDKLAAALTVARNARNAAR